MDAERSVEADFRQFVAVRSAALLRTAYLLVGDWSHAEDVLQTALTKTYLAWRRLGEIEAVEGYARRVLVTTAISWWRRRWHGERPAAVLPDPAAPDGLVVARDGGARRAHASRWPGFEERVVERQAVWLLVQALPARQRAVLVLRFYEDLTEVETARVLGVTVGTVKSQSARALTTLRTRLAEQGTEPAIPLPRPSVERST